MALQQDVRPDSRCGRFALQSALEEPPSFDLVPGLALDDRLHAS
jgi:hypothetical protein